MTTLGGGLKANRIGGAVLLRWSGLMGEATLNFAGAGLSAGAGRWVIFCVGRMLCRTLGGFFVYGGMGEGFYRLERSVRDLLRRWRFIFVLRVSAMFFATDMMAFAAMTVGFEIYLCFKNTMSDILVTLVFCTHRRQQR